MERKIREKGEIRESKGNAVGEMAWEGFFVLSPSVVKTRASKSEKILISADFEMQGRLEEEKGEILQ